ncbi:hypothetical protein DDB_G0283427 [Dictyostelium discoideum AX4]|uniref:Uncharacterized protein n=1 Tax=Dictyostelium discoideum TaxID=44689 RepID=Q54R24_DICDI|nr:hypothetical protein DDB_G0283427 [Dictyostelium discoideum AX4]EAL65698.1 hypothetical protein DDB_G0283427 [Dictyostelium discoideum AX4]|eukprot:XP_639067.1 hypothetical protein DDB_G0283427 [Dictyostelium discoideum AX4]
MNKIHYFDEFLQEMFAEEKLDGVIIKRNLSKEEFENFENKYEEFQFEYEPNDGLFIIFQNLTTGCGHSTCVSALATIFFVAISHYQGGDVIDQYFKSSIRLEGDVIQIFLLPYKKSCEHKKEGLPNFKKFKTNLIQKKIN